MTIEWLAGNRIRGTSAERTISDTPPIVTTDGSYTVIKYNQNGKFIPTSAFNVEYLVIGGGAGGAARIGGGGGAGGYQTNFGGTAHGVTAKTYDITIGIGGAGGHGITSSGSATNGDNGGNSSFDTFTSLGGGGGGTYQTAQATAGSSGGSGGGGGGNASGSSGGTSSSNGNNGGTGLSGASSAGGGGGSGGAGGNGGNSSTGGVGGVGSSNSITGTAIYYAGGGAGSADSNQASGGNGGGGNGGSNDDAYPATSGTNGLGAGGGGDRRDNNYGGTGGSGVVIIRFLTSGSSYSVRSDAVMSLPSGVGGWKELGRVKLDSVNSSMIINNLSDKRYLMVFSSITSESSNADVYHQLNNNTFSKYSNRGAYSGTEFSAQNSTTGGWHSTTTGSTTPMFTMGYFANISGHEKLMAGGTGVRQISTAASGAPERSEMTSKWQNNSGTINSVNITSGSSVTFGSGSEVVVLGYDPDDTHTDNFWEELASVDLSGGSATSLSSGTFTSKKYIWFQVYTHGATTEQQFKFNSSTGQEYASLRSGDGGTDTAFVNLTQSKVNATGGGGSHTGTFMNGFILNNASSVKLIMTHQVATEQTGNTSPRSADSTTKWTNASDLITSIQIVNGAGTAHFGTNSIMKVWGHD